MPDGGVAEGSRDWRSFWRGVSPAESSTSADALKQVGKTQFGTPVDESQIALIVHRIVDALDIASDDRVLDLGCGNGFITDAVAALTGAELFGFDISPTLVADAIEFRSDSGATYAVADLARDRFLDTDGSTATAVKAYSYEVFQHFDHADAERFVAYLGESAVQALFLASIPDAARIRNFYDTDDRWAHYLASMEAGTEQIGTWWNTHDVEALAERGRFECRILSQPTELYTSRYRFDALLTRRHGDA